MSDQDRTGRAQMRKNVLASWASYVVFIVFGFVMPRAIDESIGQVALGVWDFAWSVVHYLSLSMIGIGSSVNRYVARYRAKNDTISLSRSVSSVNAIQIAIAIFVLLGAYVLSIVIPGAMSDRLGQQGDETGALILILGASLAVQMAFDVFRGILTGCHRWLVYNVLNAGGYAVAASGMLVVLMLGHGLVGMATVYLVATIGTELLRALLSRRVCPEAEFSTRHVNFEDMKKMVKFGAKTILIGLPRMITLYTVNIFVVANLGAAMLAVLARPVALVGHIMSLIEKFANVLTPTAGSLQSMGQSEELREFSISVMRIGWIFAAVPLIFLAILGDKIVHLWMGNGYANPTITVILACGSIFSMAQFALLKIMVGLDEHGRIARQCLINSISALTIGTLILQFYDWSLVAAAMMVIIPSIVGPGIVVPYLGCQVLGIGPREYFSKVLKDPVVVILVAAPALLMVRLVGPDSAALMLVFGFVTHAVVVSIILHRDLQSTFKSFSRGKPA